MESLADDKGQDDIIIKCSLEEMVKVFFKDYEIIWHDPNVNSLENLQYMIQLEKFCKVKIFTEWKQAEDYIKTAKTVCHVITSGTNGELLVKEIFSSQNVPEILTFCRNEEYHSAWTKNYNQKVLCTETKIENVISQIQKNLFGWHKQTSSLKFDLPAFASIFDESDKSQMNHLHLYLKVIPNFHNRSQAKLDILSLSKAVYSDKKNEKLIAGFEQTYNEYNKEVILKWYTQQSFLYKMINNCLRIATSDSIQWSRLLLKDIEKAIKDQYQAKSKDFSGVLYRAAYLSEKEWLSLKDNVNREIEMHGFLSVSKEKSVAVKFMGVDPTQKVFITIIVPKGPIDDEQGFAEIDEFSKFPKEKEVLFNVRSRFTVLETEDEYSKDSPYRHLVLLYGAQGLRKFMTEKNPAQKALIENIESIMCSRCQVPTGEMTEKMLFMSLANPEKRIYSCQECLDDNIAVPFLCISATEEVSSTTEFRGCLLINSNQSPIPLYGYKCSKCGVKNQKRYFVCTDCSENKKKWCESCFGKTLSCTEMRHAIILENYPFSFWCEKMPENELNHLKFQNELVAKDHLFLQAEMYFETHEYEKSIEFYSRSIVQDESKCRNNKLISSFRGLGSIYFEQGDYTKALEYYLKSLEIAKSVHGENHPDIATSYNNIGLAYNSQGEYMKALPYQLKALDIKILFYGENHPDVAACYNNIGKMYGEQGEHVKALEYHLKSLEIYKSVHGENHPRVAVCYSNTALMESKQGEDMKALEYHLKSLDIRKSAYGENHPEVADSYNNIGLIYSKQGEDTKALEYHLKSLNSRKLVYGENSPEAADSYSNIGLVYNSQGEYMKALSYQLKALVIKILFYGENHPDVAACYNNIGLIYGEQEEHVKALEYHLKSLEIYKSVHGENHPDIADSYHNVGLIYDEQGEHKKALEYHLKSLNIRKSVYGESHPDIADSYNNIGLIYDEQGEHMKALEYHLKSLNISKSIFGEYHPDIANSYNNIGLLYDGQGEHMKALEYHLKSLDVRKSVYFGDHPDIATSYHNIGLIYDEQEEHAKALEYFLNCLDIYKSIYGENHPKTIKLHNKICKMTGRSLDSKENL